MCSIVMLVFSSIQVQLPCLLRDLHLSVALGPERSGQFVCIGVCQFVGSYFGSVVLNCVQSVLQVYL